jgi:hypothetical protein
MTCLTQPPATLDAWLALVNTCATQAGGADWPSLALTGLATVALVGLLVLAVSAWVFSWKS